MAKRRTQRTNSLLRRFLYQGKGAFFRQCAAGILVASLLAGFGLLVKLNLATASLLYLLLVVSTAVHFGFWQASVVSLVAIGCETFFFAPPQFSFYIADPRNGLALVIFELTALLVSRVSAREKQHAIESDMEKRRTQKLYSVSNDILLLNPQLAPERQIAEFIAKEFELDAVGVISESSWVGAAGAWTGEEAFFRPSFGKASSLPDDVVQRNLYNSSGKIGALLVLGDISPMAMDSLASLVVLALERHQAYVNESYADEARKTEQLRTTVLDGLAHAIKTPLTIIRAASSGLLEMGGLPPMHQQFAEMIDEQSIRIEELTTKLLLTSRAEDDNLCLQLEAVEVPALVNEVVREFQDSWPERSGAGMEGPTINISLGRRPSPIVADHEMVSTTLRELLTNAAKYSHPGSPICITAEDSGTELTLSVKSFGPVIRPEDRERIFEKFYRSTDHKHTTAGSGLGLSVARRVTEAHGGQIWFTSDECDGTTFHLSLPRNTHFQTHPQNGVRTHDETVIDCG